MQNVTTLLFDLDGTLVDTAPDIHDALQASLEQAGLPLVSEDLVRRWIGNGAGKLCDRAITGDMAGDAPKDLAARVLALFLVEYEKRICERSCLYEGVRDGLDRLRADGYRLGCVTNKPEGLARELLIRLDLGEEWISVVVGGDTLPVKKPDPAPVYHAMEAFGASAASTMFVGDSNTDVRTARNAGIGVVCVPYGYNHGDDIHDSRPDAVVDTLIQLHRLLRSAA